MSQTPETANDILRSVLTQLGTETVDTTTITQLLQEALQKMEAGVPRHQLRYALKPGDRALFLQASCLDEMQALKHSLAEFQHANYETSAIYEKARAMEPQIFFPRVFCVEIITAPDNAKFSAFVNQEFDQDSYFARIVSELPTIDCFPIKVSKQALFVSEDDVAELRSLYKKNIGDTLAWLEVMEHVKRYELERKFTRIRENMDQESKDSLKAFDVYGLNVDESEPAV